MCFGVECKLTADCPYDYTSEGMVKKLYKRCVFYNWVLAKKAQQEIQKERNEEGD